MTPEHEELFDEDLAITSSVNWAMSDRSIDWPQVGRAADSFAENLTLLNGHRRRAKRIELLQAQGRAVAAEGPSRTNLGVSPAKAAESASGDLARILRLVAGKLPPAAHALVRYFSQHVEGAAALRSWLRHVGFSNGEIDWLFEELKAVDHEFFKMLDSAGDLDALLDHAYRGEDMTRLGFPSVEGAEIPAALQRMVGRFAAKGVTPSLLHTLPVVVAMVYLADWKEGAKVSHPSYENTIFALVGARGDCYSDAGCSGSPIARNVTAAVCKRRSGKSLSAGDRCIRL